MRGKTVLVSLLVGVAACATPVVRESRQTEPPRLQIRHPERIHVAFAAASVEQLDQWTDRLLDAASCDDVFASA